VLYIANITDTRSSNIRTCSYRNIASSVQYAICNVTLCTAEKSNCCSIFFSFATHNKLLLTSVVLIIIIGFQLLLFFCCSAISYLLKILYGEISWRYVTSGSRIISLSDLYFMDRSRYAILSNLILAAHALISRDNLIFFVIVAGVSFASFRPNSKCMHYENYDINTKYLTLKKMCSS